MTLVVDASAVVAALVDRGPDGTWALEAVRNDDLAAPHLMPAEVANILRRGVLARWLSADVAALAHGDLLELPVALFAFEPLAARVWDLRENVTTYDAWYVALAEEIGAPLVTLDGRVAHANGPRCEFRLPPDR